MHKHVRFTVSHVYWMWSIILTYEKKHMPHMNWTFHRSFFCYVCFFFGFFFLAWMKFTHSVGYFHIWKENIAWNHVTSAFFECELHIFVCVHTQVALFTCDKIYTGKCKTVTIHLVIGFLLTKHCTWNHTKCARFNTFSPFSLLHVNWLFSQVIGFFHIQMKISACEM